MTINGNSTMQDLSQSRLGGESTSEPFILLEVLTIQPYKGNERKISPLCYRKVYRMYGCDLAGIWTLRSTGPDAERTTRRDYGKVTGGESVRSNPIIGE